MKIYYIPTAANGKVQEALRGAQSNKLERSEAKQGQHFPAQMMVKTLPSHELAPLTRALKYQRSTHPVLQVAE